MRYILLIFLLAGCISDARVTTNSKRYSDMNNEFNEIVKYYRDAFPEGNFLYRRFIDGSDMEPRIHIPIPLKIMTHYLHKFPMSYLLGRVTSDDPLTRMIAADLMYLCQTNKKEGGLCWWSYCGEVQSIQCVDYIVYIAPFSD